MNVCPDCETPLALTATSCRCGWTLPPKVIAPATRDEILAQRDAEHTAAAKAYCKAIGLARREDEPYDEWVARVRKHLRTTVYGRLVA
jgi:hypothetical protein